MSLQDLLNDGEPKSVAAKDRKKPISAEDLAERVAAEKAHGKADHDDPPARLHDEPQERLTRHYEASGGFGRKDVELIAAELLKIEREEGEVRVSRVIDLASDPKHPLHRFIYKDPTKVAAAKWRVMVVREICRKIKCVWIDDSGVEQFSHPMLVSVTREPGETDEGQVVIKQRRYISTERALCDPAIRDELLSEALQQVSRWREKYRNLAELAPIFSAIDAVAVAPRKRR